MHIEVGETARAATRMPPRVCAGYGGPFGVPPGAFGPQAPPTGFGPPGGGFTPPGGPMTPGSRSEVNWILPLVLGVVCSTACVDPILGAVVIALALFARKDEKSGHVDEARVKVKRALIVAGAGMSVGLVYEVLVAIRVFGG